MKGSELVGLKYEPMFKYFADREQSFKVCEDNYVTNDSGTGIVHQVGVVCVCAWKSVGPWETFDGGSWSTYRWPLEWVGGDFGLVVHLVDGGYVRPRIG